MLHTKVYPVGTNPGGEGSTGFTPHLFIFLSFAWIEIHLIFGQVRAIYNGIKASTK
jgi:hypothetical protein